MHLVHQKMTYVVVFWVMTPYSLVGDSNVLL
jgi:hypothetical protein